MGNLRKVRLRLSVRRAQKKIEVVAPSARQRLHASAAQPLPRKSAVDVSTTPKNLPDMHRPGKPYSWWNSHFFSFARLMVTSKPLSWRFTVWCDKIENHTARSSTRKIVITGTLSLQKFIA